MIRINLQWWWSIFKRWFSIPTIHDHISILISSDFTLSLSIIVIANQGHFSFFILVLSLGILLQVVLTLLLENNVINELFIHGIHTLLFMKIKLINCYWSLAMLTLNFDKWIIIIRILTNIVFFDLGNIDIWSIIASLLLMHSILIVAYWKHVIIRETWWLWVVYNWLSGWCHGHFWEFWWIILVLILLFPSTAYTIFMRTHIHIHLHLIPDLLLICYLPSKVIFMIVNTVVVLKEGRRMIRIRSIFRWVLILAIGCLKIVLLLVITLIRYFALLRVVQVKDVLRFFLKELMLLDIEIRLGMILMRFLFSQANFI